MRYYSLHWDGKTHYIAECDEHDLTVCIYRGFHNYKTNEITLYPFKKGMAYGEIGKKRICVRQVMPKSERFRRFK